MKKHGWMWLIALGLGIPLVWLPAQEASRPVPGGLGNLAVSGGGYRPVALAVRC